MTDLTQLQQQISTAIPECKLLFHEPMAEHTSFRIGGPAEVMAFPENTQQLAQLLDLSRKLDISYAILGAGTNILAPDAGMQGLVICMKGLHGLERADDSHIRVDSGVSMASAAVFAMQQGLSGLEFAHGIPGSIGGGIYMNAGAYGGEMKDVVCSVTVMDADGEMYTYSNGEMKFSYRHSRLEETGGIVTSVLLRLNHAPQEQIREYMQTLAAKRKASQPLDKPSAGSAFKRPSQGYAAALIDQAGLKGFQIGGAAVSQKHAGFVVNLGGATARDVVQLLEQVSQRVMDSSGIRLEPEVRIW